MSDTVVCSVKYKCTDYPDKCAKCKKNSGKKSYYEPTNWLPLVEPRLAPYRT